MFGEPRSIVATRWVAGCRTGPSSSGPPPRIENQSIADTLEPTVSGLHGVVNDLDVVFDRTAGDQHPAVGQERMTATEVVHYGAIGSSECLRMVERIVVENALVRVPYHAGV